jgi:hypothetical protein
MWGYLTDAEKAINFGMLSEDDFISLFSSVNLKKIAYEAEQERIRLENEKLKAEAIAKEKEIEAERKKQADLLAKQKAEADKKEADKKERTVKRTRELSTYIVFIRDYAALIEMDEADYQKAFSDIKKGAELQWEFDRKEMTRKQQEQDKSEAERKRLEDELKAKQEAECKAKEEADKKEAERIAAEKKAAKAPRKEKLTKWVESFEISKYENDDVAKEITIKFESFKKWAKSQIELL